MRTISWLIVTTLSKALSDRVDLLMSCVMFNRCWGVGFYAAFMQMRILLQALAESDVREAVSLAVSGALGELRSLLFMGAAWSGVRREVDGAEVSPALNEHRLLPLPKEGSPMSVLASTLAWVLLYEIKSVVGLASDDAVILLDSAGKIHAMNRRAEELGEKRFFFVGRGGGLVLSSQIANRAYRKNLEVFFDNEPLQHRVLVGKEMLMIFRNAGKGLGMATLTLRQVGHMVVPVETLQSVLGVSPMQARIAQAVMRGLGPVEYAKENNCSVKAARFHLYELMRRLDVHSQGELLNFLVRAFA